MPTNPTRAFVLPIRGRDVEVAEIKKLIAQAGCEVVCNDARPTDYKKCLMEADVLVVLICPETENDPVVNELVSLASREGKRVVAVWSSAAKTMDLPAVINKHGDAVIPLELDMVRQSICGGKATWTTPEGTPRPTPKTPRHKG